MSLRDDFCGSPHSPFPHAALVVLGRRRERQRRRRAAGQALLLCVLIAVTGAALGERGPRAARNLDRWESRPAPRLDPNTASWIELAQIPGCSPGLARRITAYRKEIGPIRGREDLLRIPGLTHNRWNDLAPHLEIRSP